MPQRVEKLSGVVERLDDNVLVLDCARWREGDVDPWSREAVPLIAIQERLNKLCWNGALSLQFEFSVRNLAAGRKVHLVVERPDSAELKVNGTAVPKAPLPYWRDIRWIPFDITDRIKVGLNTVALRFPEFRHGDPAQTKDQAARYGTEIEPIFLKGDFSVACDALPGRRQGDWETLGLPPVPVWELAPDTLTLVEPRPVAGDVAAEGLPFYPGRIRWSTSFQLDAPALSAKLKIGQFVANVCKVFVNGEAAGVIYRAPFTCRVGNLLCVGANKLEIVAHTTLRNMIGPHHHPEGELAWVGPRHFSSREMESSRDPAAFVAQWGSDGSVPTDWNAGYSVIGFEINDISLILS